MTSTSSPSRVGKGTPSGGQFATGSRSESDVALAPTGQMTGEASGEPVGAPVACPECTGPGAMWRMPSKCGLCEGQGFVTQAELDEWATAGGWAPNPRARSTGTGGFYNDHEPDFEQMVADRYDDGDGEAIEWGGMDVAS